MTDADILMQRLWRVVAVLGLAMAVLFLSQPSIDIQAASAFKTESAFLLSGTWEAKAQKTFIRWLTIISALSVIIGTVAVHVRGPRILGLGKFEWRFLFLSLAAGPGIFVNAILKEFWGRARPQYVEQLGGDKTFTPPFIITDQCDSNCSFVSGDSAIAFWTMALTFVVPPRWRVATLMLTFLLGVVISFFRMAQGKHFLSDTFFAFVFVTLFTALSWWIARRITRREAE